MLVGAVTLMLVATLHAAWQGRGALRSALVLSIPFVILLAAFTLYVFEVVLSWHYVNLTSWAPLDVISWGRANPAGWQVGSRGELNQSRAIHDAHAK